MKRIIELPDKVVEAIQNGEDYRYDIHTAIAHGTPYNPSDDCISREALEKSMRKSINERYKHWDKPITVADIATLIFDEIDNAQAVFDDKAYSQGYKQSVCDERNARPQDKWGKWVITEVQCPECMDWFNTDCYSMEELNKCPNCGAKMKGGAEE